MKNCLDFIEYLGPDTSARVLERLDDAGDLVRASAVSRSWRKFVVSNGFCKRLCQIISPEVSIFARTTEVGSSHAMAVGTSNDIEWVNMDREHRVYGYLGHCLLSPMEKRDCILQSLWASTTDNFPEKSIDNTLVSGDRKNSRPSYWSSKGVNNPEIPESLTYMLHSKLCIVQEIKIRPFQAFFEPGNPIYSARSVRFRMGYSKLHQEKEFKREDRYTWTYVSSEFPMIQENVLQSFKFPRPVICIGGVLQIELLGRVQKHEVDELYYICVCHVQVIGTNLSVVFSTDLPSVGGPILKHFPESRSLLSTSWAPQSYVQQSVLLQGLSARIRRLRGGVLHPWPTTTNL